MKIYLKGQFANLPADCRFRVNRFKKFLRSSVSLLFLTVCPFMHLSAFPELMLKGENTINPLGTADYTYELGREDSIQNVLHSPQHIWRTSPKEDTFLYNRDGRHLWFRFDLKNESMDSHYFIRVREFALEKIICYLIFPDGTIQRHSGGTKFPLKSKTVYSSDSIFPVTLKTGENVRIYIDIQAPIITYSYMEVQSSSSLLDGIIKEHFFLGIYYGLLLFMVILSLATYFYLRDNSYLFFMIFVLLQGLFQMARTSIGTYFLYPDWPERNLDIWYFCLIFSFSMGSLFSRSFLNMQTVDKRINSTMLYLSAGVLIFLPLPYVISANVVYIIGFLGIIYTAYVLYCAFRAMRANFRPAKYFFIGWGAFFLGIAVSIYSKKHNIITEYSSLLGSSVQMFFMTFAILSNANRIKREKEEISAQVSDYQKELNFAKKIQESLLPEKTPKLEGVEIKTFYLPMKQIGGDFFGFHTKKRESISCIVADVSGHGAAAALIASMLKVAFSDTEDMCHKPAEALRKINESLYGNLGKQFVTAVYVHIDIRHMNMTVSTSAHPAVIVQRKNEDKFHYISSKGQMIGIFPDLKVQEIQFKLQKNDRILIYTDGLLEAFNDKGEMFDEKNLEIALEANKNMSVDGLVHLLAYRLKEWIGPLKDFEDDITMVVVDIL